MKKLPEPGEYQFMVAFHDDRKVTRYYKTRRGAMNFIKKNGGNLYVWFPSRQSYYGV